MHCRWAVTLRPRRPEQTVSSSAVFTGRHEYHQRLFVDIDCREISDGPPRGGAESDCQEARTGWIPAVSARPIRLPDRPQRRESRTVPPAAPGALRPGRGAGAAGQRGTSTSSSSAGGITGAGVALDAAARGLRTALVERHDFASGTSSKSSKMVHGGLRYLQQRDFRLVYEALAERQRLLDNAPHLVSPLPFLIPLSGGTAWSTRAVARAYATALWLYDLTGGWRIGKRHRRIDRAEALAHLPTLRTDRLVAASSTTTPGPTTPG